MTNYNVQVEYVRLHDSIQMIGASKCVRGVVNAGMANFSLFMPNEK